MEHGQSPMSLSASPLQSNGSLTDTADATSAAPVRPRQPLGSPDAASPSPTQKRLQVPRACERCKRLRRGCSDYRPCRRCTEAGLGDQCQTNHLPNFTTSTDLDPLHQRLAAIVTDQLLDHCVSRFFETLHPTIPILTAAYITRLRSAASIPDAGLASLCALAGMCAQVLLQTEGFSSNALERRSSEDSDPLGRVLLDTTTEVYRQISMSMPIQVETCLSAFFLYACEASLCHHSLAFRYLRDATTTLILFRTPEADEVVKLVTRRLFWVVLISERSHAIRYRRPVTLQINDETPGFDTHDETLAGFWSLAALFRPLDTTFIALHNHEAVSIPPSPDSLSFIESTLNSALGPGFNLHNTQKANLRVTQLWLRVIIWQLRLRLGHLVEESYQHSLTFGYPIEVAKDLVLSTRDLPLESFKVHGVGLTEKLFDIASALIDVMSRIPATSATVQTLGLGTLPQDNLYYIRSLIRRLPKGDTIYDDLLEKHLQQAVPDLVEQG
ncbi:sucrose utilization protein-like protein [Paramyrothecium foliicola]|nr:sucrose utilization protein-like protein [Paramyrothecium foliicola]